MNRGLLSFVLVASLAGVGTGAYAVADSQRPQERTPTGARDPVPNIGAGARIVFRHTGTDTRFGLVASVSLGDPAGDRTFTELACDRVDATPTGVSCLRTQRGVVTTYEAVDLDAGWEVRETTPLPGIPSRTRLSADGSLVATTTFISGHSYQASEFSTATEVRQVGGATYGNLEHFDLVIHGRKSRPTDRNVWGVTFVDDRNFFASVATGDTTYLTKGDLVDRTLTVVTENAECPSLSPDGTRVAFKVDLDPGADTRWSAAVLDLESGKRTQLDTPGIDDQVEWLDDDTLIYGLPRTDEAGVTDVWSVDVHREAEPTLLIEQAWSPSVVTEGTR